MNEQEILLSKPQFRLLTTESQFPAFVGGFGSGKTAALIERCINRKVAYPTCDVGYYLPTYDLASLIVFPRIEQRLEELHIPYRFVKSPRPEFQIEKSGRIILRTMDRPSRIVGYETADSLLDELDTLKLEDAKNVWQKVIARNRQKKPDGSRNTIAVGTTPEGFKFVYEQWQKKKPSDQYELIKASTRSNARNLPEDYIQSLYDTYPENLISAYIEGNFVNLTSGSVYINYNRIENRSAETIQAKEPLHIGLDFNVTKMAAVVFVNRGGWPHAVGELTKMFDTPAAIETIKSRWPDHPIFIYPDATGAGRETNNASVSDISLLKAAKFQVCANTKNPAVRDRVLAVNILLLNGKKERHLLVNDDLCPSFAESLEKQAYDKNGEPDKSGDLDHIVDAGGYFVSYRFPVKGGKVVKLEVAGV